MKKKKIILSFILLIFISIIISGCTDADKKDYDTADGLYKTGDYKTAAEMFVELGDYKDSGEMANKSFYAYAGECFKKQDFDEAIKIYESIGNYSDSPAKIKEVENEQVYVAAVKLMNNHEYDTAKDMFMIIREYKDSVEFINGILYDEAVMYMNESEYEKAVEIFSEISEYKDSDELFELCNKYIKYYFVIETFNNGKIGKANLELYDALIELGDFLDSENYMTYLNAKIFSEENDYGHAAENYLAVSEIFDCADFYELYLYMYYDQQFNIGNKDLSILPLLPLNDDTKYNDRRDKRVNDFKESIKDNESLTEYYTRTDRSTLDNVTGIGIYVNDSWAHYGAGGLINKIISDVPVFFLADSPKKARYVMNFRGYAIPLGHYEINGVPDGTIGYQTVVIATIKNTVTGEILFTKNYTADPPHETNIIGDVYAEFDFIEKTDDGLSVYEKDIRPVLAGLFE